MWLKYHAEIQSLYNPNIVTGEIWTKSNLRIWKGYNYKTPFCRSGHKYGLRKTICERCHIIIMQKSAFPLPSNNVPQKHLSPFVQSDHENSTLSTSHYIPNNFTSIHMGYCWLFNVRSAVLNTANVHYQLQGNALCSIKCLATQKGPFTYHHLIT